MDERDRPRLQTMVTVAGDLVQRDGLTLTDAEREFLQQRQDDMAEGPEGWRANEIVVGERRLRDISNSVLRGFFDAAAQGVEYGRGDELATNYSSRVETNYPEASNEFIRFARTYWSIKGLISTIHPPNRFVVQELLSQIEIAVGKTFFPFPGHRVNPDVREKKQREVLEEFAPKIDVEEFMRGNPILIRDRRGRDNGGCTSVLALVAFTLGLWIIS